MKLRPFVRLLLLPGLAAQLLLASGCATRSTGIPGEGSAASNAPTNTRDVAPGVKGNVNRTGTGGG